MQIERRKTRHIQLGKVVIGDPAPIAVQSMTNTDTRDVSSTVRQIRRLEKAGCEIVRLGIPDMDAAKSLGSIKAKTNIPVVADIHFDYRLALEAMKQGIDGLRLNPGNIGSAQKVKEVSRVANDLSIPIRIGVNSGSTEKGLLRKYGGPSPEAMVESALSHVGILEKVGFSLIKISLKASDVPRTVAAYRLLADRVDYPLHLGITEAGTLLPGTVKSSIGIGLLLAQGIGDTIRVSLTAPPEKEVHIAFNILRALGIRERGVEIVSCPTCSRTSIDVIDLAVKVEKRLSSIVTPLKVAVMGCAVNGPGEAREADVGIAGGKGMGVLFKKGKSVGAYPEKDLLNALVEEVLALAREKGR
jgi:(E)-4-hydroxy-3-methylbut-2-enyl-diphosphate synthase